MLFSTSFYLWHMVYEDYSENIKAAFNELILLLVLYHQICLTEFTLLEAKTSVGNSMLCLIAFSVVINVGIFVASQAKMTFLRLKKYFLRFKMNVKRLLGIKPPKPVTPAVVPQQPEAPEVAP
jgi:hypothetical protein